MAYKSIDAVMEAPEGPRRCRPHLEAGGVREGVNNERAARLSLFSHLCSLIIDCMFKRWMIITALGVFHQQ